MEFSFLSLVSQPQEILQVIIGEPARRPKKWALERRILRTDPRSTMTSMWGPVANMLDLWTAMRVHGVLLQKCQLIVLFV